VLFLGLFLLLLAVFLGLAFPPFQKNMAIGL